jgi:long-chain acyl-CoA synthetase
METAYGNSPFVDAIAGGVCCYGDGEMDRPIALLQLNEVFTMRWAEENSINGDFFSVKKSDELHAAILVNMEREAEKSGISYLERLAAVSLLTDPWTPENGCLTAANKLQRRVIIEEFSREFEAIRVKGIF